MIGEMIHRLLELPGEVWDAYAFRAEPLSGKITPAQRAEFAAGARECGQELARELIREKGRLTALAYAQALGAAVTLVPAQDDGNYTMFASFTEPDQIRVFQNTALAAARLIGEQGLADALGHVDVGEVLITHELYHYLECTRPDLYTARRLLRLWKLGPLRNDSKVLSLQEIGAMAFTRELLGLSFSPYVFDVLLLYVQNKRLAKQLYDAILKLAEKKE